MYTLQRIRIIVLSKRYQTLDTTVQPRSLIYDEGRHRRRRAIYCCRFIDKLDRRRRRSFKKQTTAAAHPLLFRGPPFRPSVFRSASLSFSAAIHFSVSGGEEGVVLKKKIYTNLYIIIYVR